MIKLYPNRVRTALMTLTVASFSIFSASAQTCPTGFLAATAGTTYNNGQVACVSGNFSTGTITLNSGSQLVVSSNGTFTGDINAASNVQIYVQAGGTFQPKSLNNFVGKITNYGTSTITSNLSDGTEISNNLKMTIGNNVNIGNVTITNSACGSMSFAGKVTFNSGTTSISNNGYVSVGGNLTFGQGNQLTNRGKFYVGGSASLNGKITNDGYIVFGGGNNSLQGSDSLINKNVMVFKGSSTIEKAIRNDGLFWIGGSTTFQNANNFKQVNTNAYLRIDGAMSNYGRTIAGNGVARIAGAYANYNGGMMLLTLTTTVKDTTNYTATGANAAKPCGIDESSPLPIILQNFTAKASGSAAQLNWSTVSELNGKAMIVQHSTDGVNFEDIETVASTTNSSLVQNYSYIDNNVANGVNYYRLKLVSSDAPLSYSAVVAVKFNTTTEQQSISVFPNPFSDHFTVKFADVKGGNVVAKLYNAQGAVILVQSFNSAASVTINTPANLAKGVYVLEISTNGEKYYHRLMKL